MSPKLDYLAASSNDIAAELGSQVESIRLANNITQKQLAAEAGISVRTLGRFENGASATLDTFVRVLIALKLQQNLENLLPDPAVRPVERMQGAGRERKRASGVTSDTRPAQWTWQDEEPETT